MLPLALSGIRLYSRSKETSLCCILLLLGFLFVFIICAFCGLQLKTSMFLFAIRMRVVGVCGAPSEASPLAWGENGVLHESHFPMELGSR